MVSISIEASSRKKHETINSQAGAASGKTANQWGQRPQLSTLILKCLSSVAGMRISEGVEVV